MNRIKKRILLAASAVGISIVAVFAFFAGMGSGKEESAETFSRKVSTQQKTVEDSVPVTQEAVQEKFTEEEVYTFLQGPKSWGEQRPWSGEWGTSFFDGGSFGGFGCGLCCLANIYSSLTNYQCTPAEVYRYAKRKTEYAGGGAIAWGYLRRTLNALGFECGVKKKTDAYQEFQNDIKKSKCAIALVSSADSVCYWKETPGHYVTIFLYDEESDSVFLADSGEPKHNRKRVPLKKIYRSLKTASEWQYLLVGEYDKKKDEWKHKKAEGNWIQPEM